MWCLPHLSFEISKHPKVSKMIREKVNLAVEVLEAYPQTRGDKGADEFLNIISRMMFKDKQIDFKIFKVETYTRARRKALEENPYLDNRTRRTDVSESIARAEMVA